MAIGARVESLDALRSVKVAMAKFAEHASAALGEADAELQRAMIWLETEQLAYWQVQQRTRAERASQAQDALRMKKLYKGAGGRTPSAVDEEKAFALAMRRLEEAEQKIVAVKKWTPKLKNEIRTYHGGVQRLATTLEVDVPTGIAKLDAMIGSLEAYLELKDSAGGDLPRGQPTDANGPPPDTAGGAEGEPKPTE